MPFIGIADWQVPGDLSIDKLIFFFILQSLLQYKKTQLNR